MLRIIKVSIEKITFWTFAGDFFKILLIHFKDSGDDLEKFGKILNSKVSAKRK